MEFDFYNIVLVGAGSLLCFFSISLLATSTPERLRGTTYLRSRKIISFGFLTLALELILSLVLNIRSQGTLIVTATNLSTFYLLSIFFSASLTPLISKENLLTRKAIIFDVARYCIFLTLLWSSMCLAESLLARHITIGIAIAIYIARTIRCFRYFFMAYRTVVEYGEENYSDDFKGMIKWMSNSAIFATVLAILPPAISFSPRELTAVVIILITYGFSYIYIKFIKYIGDFSAVDNMVASEEEEEDEQIAEYSEPQKIINDEYADPTTIAILDSKVQKWLFKKGYCQNGINLVDLAHELETNRSYLSRHINSKYNSSFKEWIALNRIDEAKRIMKENSHIHIFQVAVDLGFTSTSTFSRTFSKYVNISPTEWRDLQNLH